MLLFIMYVAFTSFAVLNVVTGVFCETAIAGAQEEREEAVTQQMDLKSKLFARLQEIFEDLDMDSSGGLTIDEFEQSLDDERLKAYFASMDLDISEAWNLFKLLDTDGSHIIDIREFVEGCFRLRGSAKSIDIAMLTYESRWMIERFSAFAESVEEQFDILRAEMQASSPARLTWRDPSADSKDAVMECTNSKETQNSKRASLLEQPLDRATLAGGGGEDVPQPRKQVFGRKPAS
eukprot:UN1208